MAKTEWAIRHLLPHDRAIWVGYWNGYMEFYEHTMPAHITEATFERLTSDDPYFVGLAVIDEAGHMQGFAHYIVHASTWTDGYHCYLEDLFVNPAVRSSGAARALIEEIYRRAHEAGWSTVYWITQSHNETARRLYDKLATEKGFVMYEREI